MSRPAACLAACLPFLLVATSALAQETPPAARDWQPTSEFSGEHDWMQMDSLEWLKGEVVIMYNDRLEFDSDEFDEVYVDWDDIRELRTTQKLTIARLDRSRLVGTMWLRDGVVTVTGNDGTVEIAKDDVLSITAGEPREINFWTAKLFFGLTARSGNSDTFDVNLQAKLQRRTVTDRFAFEFLGNRSTSGEVELSDNTRISSSWDRVVGRRFFIRPVFFEYFRDPFQNLAFRSTIGAGAGYMLIDGADVTWDVFIGPAYQRVESVDVAAGEDVGSNTPAFVFATSAEWDITGWLELDGSYAFQLVNDEAGKYNHHLLASFEVELTRRLDVDLMLVWERVQNPREAADGTIPEQDDWRTVIGLTFDF